MQAPMPPPSPQDPERLTEQEDGKSDEVVGDGEVVKEKELKERQDRIKKLIGSPKEFTGNKIITWDNSVTSVREQITIQKLGWYVANSKSPLPDILKKNIDTTAKSIRDRGGIILQEDLEGLLNSDMPLDKAYSIGIISIFVNPLLLFYCPRYKSGSSTLPLKWKLLKFQNIGGCRLEVTDFGMEETLKTIGKLGDRDVKHTLIAFSIHSLSGVKIRNGLVYNVGSSKDGSTSNTNTFTADLTRSLTPTPRMSSPIKTRADLRQQRLSTPPKSTPRFQLTPLEVAHELADPEELNKIQIRNIATKEDIAEASIQCVATKALSDIQCDNIWRLTKVELEGGIVLHIKYKLKKTDTSETEPETDPDLVKSKKGNRNKSNVKKKKITKASNPPKPKEGSPQTEEIKTILPSQTHLPKEREPNKNKNNGKRTNNTIQLYKTSTSSPPYNPLTSIKDSYKLDATPPRKISSILLRHFTETFTIRKPENAQYVLLNLPGVAVDSSQAMESRLMHIQQPVERKAQSLFMKGKFADAYSLIIDGDSKLVDPEYSEVAALFPPQENESKLEDMIKDLPKSKDRTKIYEKHVAEAIAALKGGKGCGPSGMSSELIKQLWRHEPRVREKIVDVVDMFINNPNNIKDNFFHSNLHCIPKPNGGIRPIAVEEAFTKLVNKVVCKQLMSQTLQKIHPNQFCIKETDSQIKAVKTVKQNIKSGFCNIIAVDFKNAYGTIGREHIVSQLRKMDVKSSLIRYIVHLLDKQQMHFTDSNGRARTINPIRGIAQGDPTSSLLFCIGVNDLLEEFNSQETRTIAYADDFVIMARKKSELLKTWKAFKAKSDKIGLEVNETKTRLLFDKETKFDKNAAKDFNLEPEYYNKNKHVWTYLDIPMSRNKDIIINHLKD